MGRFDDAILAVTADHGQGDADPREPPRGWTLLKALNPNHVTKPRTRPGQRARRDEDRQLENRVLCHLPIEEAGGAAPQPLLPAERDREWVVAGPAPF